MNAMFDTCIICGRQAIRPGAGVCQWHEIQALISLGYERMIERLRGNIPARGAGIAASKRNITKTYEDLLTDEL